MKPKQKSPKKRIAKPSEWKRNKTKCLRNSGEAYTSLASGKKFVAAKAVRSSCGEKCKLKCSTKVDEETRKKIFQEYWALKDLQKHRDFIFKSMKAVIPVQKPKNEDNKRRRLNNAFYLQVKYKRVRVCKAFFKATLDITDRTIRTVLSKSDADGSMEIDLRGRHCNHHRKVSQKALAETKTKPESTSTPIQTQDLGPTAESEKIQRVEAEVVAVPAAVSKEVQVELRPQEVTEAEGTKKKIKKKAKKRTSNPGEWKKNIAKTQRNSGQAYVSSAPNKKIVEAKALQPPCGEKCKLKCSTKITEEARQKLFESYWALKDLKKHRDFIFKSMQSVVPVQKSKNQERRRLNNAFYFVVNNRRIRVCKAFFKATLDITDRSIRTVLTKSEKGTLEEDLRGKHNNHPTTETSVRDSVRRHIESVPKSTGLALRPPTTKQYIERGKSIKDLYQDYREECEKNNVLPASQTMYHRIFSTEYNFAFHPQKPKLKVVKAKTKTKRNQDKEVIPASYMPRLAQVPYGPPINEQNTWDYQELPQENYQTFFFSCA